MDKWGVLAQNSPAATTLADLYTAPNSRRAIVEVVVCNRGAATTFRLSYAIAGAADAVSQYLVYDKLLDANASIATVKITVKDSDVLRCRSTSGLVTFTVNGIEENG